MKHIWTDAEILYLRKNYKNMNDFELSKKMGISPGSIRNLRIKLRYLRIKTTKAIDLTPQEKVILKLLLQGLSYKECAKALTISTATVKTHVNTIFQKKQVHSLSQLLAKSYKEQIVEYEDYIQMLEEQNQKQIEKIKTLEIRDK
mgnify:FL=1